MIDLKNSSRDSRDNRKKKSTLARTYVRWYSTTYTRLAADMAQKQFFLWHLLFLSPWSSHSCTLSMHRCSASWRPFCLRAPRIAIAVMTLIVYSDSRNQICRYYTGSQDWFLEESLRMFKDKAFISELLECFDELCCLKKHFSERALNRTVLIDGIHLVLDDAALSSHFFCFLSG